MNDDISESVSQRGSGEETVCQVPGNDIQEPNKD